MYHVQTFKIERKTCDLLAMKIKLCATKFADGDAYPGHETCANTKNPRSQDGFRFRLVPNFPFHFTYSYFLLVFLSYTYYLSIDYSSQFYT